MNNFEEKVQAVKDEMQIMTQQFEAIQLLKAENEIEQNKIIEQNKVIGKTISELDQDNINIEIKEKDLNDREKQILIREKALINSNRMLDAKLEEFRDRNNELALKENELKANQLKYDTDKTNLDRQLLITRKLEETEDMRKTRLKNKEEELDRELSRLRGL